MRKKTSLIIPNIINNKIDISFDGEPKYVSDLKSKGPRKPGGGPRKGPEVHDKGLEVHGETLDV